MKITIFLETAFSSKNILISLCSIIIALAGVWSLFLSAPSLPSFEKNVGSRVMVEGVVDRDPERKETGTRVTIAVDRLNDEALIHEKTKVIASVDRFMNVSYGDRIRLTGILHTPEAFETDGGRTFNYPQYLLAHHITHTLSFAGGEVVHSGEGNSIVSALLSLKHVLLSGIERALPEPESALLAGLLVGEKQSLGDDITLAFRNSGVIHIIVLSGYNVALVINSVIFILIRVLPRTLAYGGALVFVLGFAVLTGASETTVRATIMAVLMMIATVFHRPNVALRGLLIAGALMALWNPLLVLFDLSYQLSMVATLGLILFSERIQKNIQWVPNTFSLREILATTLATQITVLPLLILSVGVVSLVFLPANILILPLVPLAMLIGFIAALIALASPLWALPFSFVAYIVLKFIIGTAVFFGTLPSATIAISKGMLWVTLFAILVLYGVVFFVVKKMNDD